jgi:hypothetical protein
MFERYSTDMKDAVRVTAGKARCSPMLSLELGRLIHQERQQEIERTRRVRVLIAMLQPDRHVPGLAREPDRMVDEAMLGRRGFAGTR